MNVSLLLQKDDIYRTLGPRYLVPRFGSLCSCEVPAITSPSSLHDAIPFPPSVSWRESRKILRRRLLALISDIERTVSEGSLSLSLSMVSVANVRTTPQQQELRLSFGKWTTIVPGIIVIPKRSFQRERERDTERRLSGLGFEKLPKTE